MICTKVDCNVILERPRIKLVCSWTYSINVTDFMNIKTLLKRHCLSYTDDSCMVYTDKSSKQPQLSKYKYKGKNTSDIRLFIKSNSVSAYIKALLIYPSR